MQIQTSCLHPHVVLFLFQIVIKSYEIDIGNRYVHRMLATSATHVALGSCTGYSNVALYTAYTVDIHHTV